MKVACVKKWITRRGFLRTAAGAAAAALGTGLYTWRWEPHWVEVVERALPLPHLPSHWQGKTIIQLSDLHIGPQVADAFLLECFQRVNQLAPDLVVYTGDFTSHAPDFLEHTERVFAHLPQGAHGTFGILGNHDYGINWAQPEVAQGIAKLASAAGVTLLRNQRVEVRGLQIAGLDDLWARRFEPEAVLSQLHPQKPALVLSHNPDTADLAVWGDYAGWILSGHTHGGQCKPPFLPPPLLPVKNRNYTAGVFKLSGGRKLYINRGLGHLLRVRFNARPEITRFHLQTA